MPRCSPVRPPHAACRPLALGALLGLTACEVTAPDAQPATLVISPTTVELDAIGATLPLRTFLRDQAGRPLATQPVGWEVEDPSVLEVSPAGVIRALAAGESRLRARLGEAQGEATVVVQPRAANIVINTGDGQTARAGTQLPTPLRIRLTDRLGTPRAGIPWTLDTEAPGLAGGFVLPTGGATGPGGEVELRWTLGLEAGVQSLVLRADARTFHLAATATEADGRVPFRIRIRPLGAVSPEVLQAAERGAARWSALMDGKLTPLLARAPAGRCGADAPALDEIVDDLLVFLSEQPVDGPGGAAAVAGPCFIRKEGLLPVVGRIVVDAEDVSTLQGLELLDDVLTHEFGHVLGFGTLWERFNLLAASSLPDARGADTPFLGPLARAAFDAAGGIRYPGARVPVENELGGVGVRDAHWRASVFGVELMNPFLVAGLPHPLSEVTAASLADLGYTVRPGAADPWTLPPFHAREAPAVPDAIGRPGATPYRIHAEGPFVPPFPLRLMGDGGELPPFAGASPSVAPSALLRSPPIR